MNTHKKLIEEKVVNSQCNPGDVVTGWVIQSDKVREILQDTIDTVSMIVREEEAVEYNKIIDTVLEGERERVDKIIKQHTSWKPAAGYGSKRYIRKTNMKQKVIKLLEPYRDYSKTTP